MEKIQRSLMLLKPGSSTMVNPAKNGGTLRLQSDRSGLVLSLKTDSLQDGQFSVYLFLQDGRERFAGELSGGSLFATLYDVRLEDVAGAAVVFSEGGNHAFCLTTAGMDWPAVSTRFRMARAAKPAQNDGSRDPAEDDPAPGTADLSGRMQKAPMPNSTSEYGNAPGTDVPSGTDDAVENDFADSPNVYDDAGNDAADSPGAYGEYGNVYAASAADDAAAAADPGGNAQNPCDACPHVIRQDKINPFPSVFPDSEWVKISYPGPTGWWHYISGKIYKGSALVAKVLGVPGEYGMAPPIWLEGFGTYMRCATGDAGGYWLMFQDAETGEVLDIGISPHGG